MPHWIATVPPDVLHTIHLLSQSLLCLRAPCPWPALTHLSALSSGGSRGGGGQGGQLPPPFSSPPFSFLLVVCVVSVTVHTTPALYGARRSPPKYVAQKARASPVGDSLTQVLVTS